jgi:hypothetical protein
MKQWYCKRNEYKEGSQHLSNVGQCIGYQSSRCNPSEGGQLQRMNTYVKFSRRRVWSSELSSGMYCRVK